MPGINMERTTFSSLKKSELKNIKQISFLNELVERNISVYAVSDLINFSFENLEEYSSSLKQNLKNKIQIDNVNFNVIKGMESSLPALAITIENRGKVKYEAILLSLYDNFQNNDIPYRFPVLCVIKDNAVKIIHSNLEKLFTCSIIPCCLNQTEFLWLAAISINESILRKKNDGISISYSLPNYPKQDAIDLRLPDQSLEAIWLACRPDPLNHVLTLNEVNTFFDGLLAHINSVYGINLQSCNMEKVSIEEIILNNGGEKFQMRIYSDEILYHILSFIHADCVKRLFSY